MNRSRGDIPVPEAGRRSGDRQLVAFLDFDQLGCALIDESLQIEMHSAELRVGSHPCQDFLFLERLGDEIHATSLEPKNPIFGIVQRADEDDGDVTRSFILMQLPADLIAVHVRHPDVQQNQRGRSGLRRVDGHLPRFGRSDPVTLLLQKPGEQLQVRDLVVDDQDVFFSLHERPYSLTPSSLSRSPLQQLSNLDHWGILQRNRPMLHTAHPSSTQ